MLFNRNRIIIENDRGGININITVTIIILKISI